MQYKVAVGGTKRAKDRWATRVYKHLSSAQRRIKKIKDSHDLGVATIGLIPMEEEPITLRLSQAELQALLKQPTSE